VEDINFRAIRENGNAIMKQVFRIDEGT